MRRSLNLLPERAMNFTRDSAADLWKNTLSQIPTTFGKLVYLASLRDQNTGAYEHFGFAQLFGEQAARQTLALSHKQLFEEWVQMTLQSQKEDLDDYLSGLDTDLGVVISTWIRIAPYRNLIPAETPAAEREHYMANTELLLELLRREHGVASSDPNA
jgi:hypothetical protein